jgi:hypothetical protein
MEGTIKFNARSMKVLGEIDGKLAFINAPDDYLQFGEYLPANKAYLPIAFQTDDVLFLLDKDDYAGIKDIRMDEKATGIYNLKGQKIQSKDQLQQGVYIVNGKKFIKK